MRRQARSASWSGWSIERPGPVPRLQLSAPRHLFVTDLQHAALGH